MGRYFRVEVAIKLRAAENGAQAMEELAEPICHLLALPSCDLGLRASKVIVTRNGAQPWDRRAWRGARGCNMRVARRASAELQRRQTSRGPWRLCRTAS